MADVQVRRVDGTVTPVRTPAAFVGVELPVGVPSEDPEAGNGQPGTALGRVPLFAAVGGAPGAVHPCLARAHFGAVVQLHTEQSDLQLASGVGLSLAGGVSGLGEVPAVHRPDYPGRRLGQRDNPGVIQTRHARNL